MIYHDSHDGKVSLDRPRPFPGRAPWDDLSMAYDEELAERIRDELEGQSDVTTTKMFGGLAFLVGGNMAVAASGQGGLLVRVDPGSSDELVAGGEARPMEMRGREMAGWVRVDAADVRGRQDLVRWIRLGTTYARSLPPKKR
jgi:TfoX/Sxy family transcriptional regulator of competence genes